MSEERYEVCCPNCNKIFDLYIQTLLATAEQREKRLMAKLRKRASRRKTIA